MTSTYHETYTHWKNDPEAFWRDVASDISWIKPPETIFDEREGIYGRWYSDGLCNTCYNCIDRQIFEGRGEQAAIIYDSPITGKKQTFTYNQLLQQVSALAASLNELGVDKGTRVIIYMPMVPQAVFAMLACARIGAIHSVVFGGFAANELATRINDAQPKVIISASCGIEPNRTIAYKPLLDEAIEIADNKPEHCIILQREELDCSLIDGRDFDYQAMIEKHKDTPVECAAIKATDPLYVLYTSGTTGQPKGVVRDNGGHMAALKYSMHAIYDIKPGEVFWAASDVGWVVGHSYIVYAPLLQGATSIIFEGKPVGTPDAGVFWRIIEEHNVRALFTAPTAFRAIKQRDPEGELLKNYDISCLRTLFLAGERADPETIKWAENKLKIPVIDHWWQTETGWTIAGNPVGLGALPVKYGSPCVPMPGYAMEILDDDGVRVPSGTLGNVVIKLPLPPSSLPTLWNNDERFKSSYLTRFEGYYDTADAGIIDDDGYVFIMARTDDIINVAGHRLSTGGMEEVVAQHRDVGECAVVGIADTMKGQIPCAFIVLNMGVTRSNDDIEREIIALVREKIGPVAAFKLVICVPRLPKTRSGKILRATIQKIADKQEWKMPATIDDPAILDEITSALHLRGIGI